MTGVVNGSLHIKTVTHLIYQFLLFIQNKRQNIMQATNLHTQDPVLLLHLKNWRLLQDTRKKKTLTSTCLLFGSGRGKKE